MLCQFCNSPAQQTEAVSSAVGEPPATLYRRKCNQQHVVTLLIARAASRVAVDPQFWQSGKLRSQRRRSSDQPIAFVRCHGIFANILKRSVISCFALNSSSTLRLGLIMFGLTAHACFNCWCRRNFLRFYLNHMPAKLRLDWFLVFSFLMQKRHFQRLGPFVHDQICQVSHHLAHSY